MRLTVLDLPAAALHVARLRDVKTGPQAFATHARTLGLMLAVEASRGLPTREVTVTTPLGPAAALVPAVDIVAVPVLRAGLGLLDGVRQALPTATVGMIGLERDETTLEAREYYRKLPDLSDAYVLVLEPMLATGGSAADAAARLHAAGVRSITVLGVVATQVAVDRILDVGDEVSVVTAALDPELNDVGYIVPGLGDFGDRLFGTPG